MTSWKLMSLAGVIAIVFGLSGRRAAGWFEFEDRVILAVGAGLVAAGVLTRSHS